ncbi:hypothetical protein LMH66_13615 [Shewanella sp. 10N.7]|uniref:hypothetical protein n=1 Tax=Shewanella sp. 10N.7 TaxID=2885093 RepID=UPI001E59FD2C|nr:hypothetical protein [Shewanella sp. 10N.7]MCC4833674.1 hypothetical protein [Shewanella sp. 10N.7]
MSSVIELLERMGQDSNLSTLENYNEAIIQAELSPELKKSLLNKDVSSLTKELNVCAELVCGLLPADEDEGEEESETESPSESKTNCN